MNSKMLITGLGVALIASLGATQAYAADETLTTQAENLPQEISITTQTEDLLVFGVLDGVTLDHAQIMNDQEMENVVGTKNSKHRKSRRARR